MLIEFVEPDFVFANEAGTLHQLVHTGWNQVNVITSCKNSKRGGHYHKFNKEGFFVVSGSFKLIVSKNDQTEEYRIKANDMFVIPPYVWHVFEYLEDTILISFYSEGVELSPTEKDIWGA